MNRKHHLILALVIAMLAVACNGNGDAPADDAADNGAEAGTQEITVSAIDIDFEPDSVDIASGTTLVVTLNNDGNLEHDFQLDDGSGTGLLQAGESETVELGPFTESTVAYCTVAGHREAGMEFDINVN